MKEIKYQQKYVRQLVDMTIDLLHKEGRNCLKKKRNR